MSSKDESEITTGTNSLQMMSTLKVLQELKLDPNPAASFLSLDDVPQNLVFQEIWKDYTRLLNLERKMKTWEHFCPAADRQLWSQRWPHINYADDDEDLSQSGLFLRREMYGKWTLLEASAQSLRIDDPDARPAVEWATHGLLQASPDSPLEVCLKKGDFCTCPEHYQNKADFCLRISAQLLLYR